MLDSLCAVHFIASLFSACQPVQAPVAGYVEGDYVLIAPLDVAQIIDLRAQRGDKVTSGTILAVLEQTDATNIAVQAEAALAVAEAQLSDLLRGRRPAELAVIEATLASAQAQAQDAARVFVRKQDLLSKGAGTQTDLDLATTARDVAAARVKEVSANLDVARQPARDGAIRAAQGLVAQLRAALDKARWRLARRTLTAQANGRIFDIIRHVGELAGPQAPVVSMLPDGAIKLKLYLPERLLSSVSIGQRLSVACDGCPADLGATISYISPEPEFTPPVIYSNSSRQKLVYLVEARPVGDAGRLLQPGQIVDAILAEPGK